MENLKIGDMQVALDLKSNMLEYAQYFLDNYDKPSHIKYFKFYIISISSFYELYFKFKLGLINQSLIWKDPTKFNSEKHVNADFQSKEAKELVSYGKNFNWINDRDETFINQIIALRNKIIHFSICEQDDPSVWRYELIDKDFFKNNKQIIVKLLKSIEKECLDNPLYGIIKKEHLS